MAAPYRKPFTPMQKLWIRCVVAGDSRAEILDKVFHTTPDDTTKAHNADCCMWRWRKHPDYEKEWYSAYREIWGEITVEAMRELRNGMRDKDLPWRRTQHVNMALTYGTKMMLGDDANTVKVQITGMPELGTPDQDDQ